MFNAGTAYRNEMNKELRGQSFVTISVRLSNFIAQSGYTITSNAINFTRDVGNIYGIRITFGTSRPSSIYLAGKRYTVDADIFETNDVFEGGLSLSATNLLQYDVAGVEFGINELVFENDDILSTSRLNKVNPLSAELPEQTFTFSLHDYNGDYSWADRSSLLYAFQKKQPVRWKYGRELEPEQLTDREEEELTDREGNLLVTDDYVEIPGGDMWLNTWTVGTDSITLTASSKLSFMDDMFYDGDAMSGKTPAEMAQAVQDYFNTAEASRSGQSVTVICNITDTTTDAPIPVESCKNCLQLIANACRGSLYQDRNGVIRIERLSDTAEDYTLGGINIMKAPVASKLEEVDVINISEASYDVSSQMTDVATVTITELNTDVYVTFDTPIDATSTILLSNSNVTLVEAHSYSATLRTTVAGEVTISAYPLLVGSVTHRAVGNANGTNIKNIENPLTVFNEYYMAWYVDYFCNDIEYSITYRGDPCIDALDLIYIQDETLDKIRIVEEELKTSVGVGLDCTITARRIESNGVSTKGKTNYKSSVFGLSSADLKAQEALELAQNAINSVRIEYAYSNSATVAPTDGWTTETLPKVDGLYIWQRTVTVSESGETPSDAACISGADGTGISDIVITYQASDNGVSAPTGTWSSTIPSVSAGSYLWTRTETITSDGNSTYSYSVARQGQDGADGTSVTILGSYNTYAELIAAHPTGDNIGDGYMVGSDLYIWNGTTWQNVGQIKGADGTDGLTYYVHLAYATSGDGEENFSTTAFDGATYLGTLTNTTSTGSTVPADYSWSLFKGENALTIQIESSDGTTFKTSAIDTILYATLYDGQTEVTASNYGTFRWYRDGGTTAVGTGGSLTVLLPTVEKAVYTVKLIDTSNNVIASASITLTAIRDIAETYWFYYTSVTQTTPTKPTTITTIPPTGWDVGIEPDYVEGSTDYVYVMQLTVFTDESFAYTDPALSASYEAAKKAAADAANAQASADAAQETAENAQTTAENAQSSADDAQATADAAQSTANTALTTANDKNTVYYDTPPAGTEFSDGDVWFDADNDNAINVWSSENNRWELRQVGENAISDLAITNAKIQDATIQDAKIVSIAAKKVAADMISANSSEVGTMNVRVIQDASGEKFYLNLETGEFRSERTQTMQESINLLSESDLLFQAPATTNGDSVTLTAVVYKSGKNIARTFAPTCFSWYLVTEEVETLLGTGYTITVNKSDVGYNGCVRAVFQTIDIEEITDRNSNALTTRTGEVLTARHAS